MASIRIYSPVAPEFFIPSTRLPRLRRSRWYITGSFGSTGQKLRSAKASDTVGVTSRPARSVFRTAARAPNFERLTRTKARRPEDSVYTECERSGTGCTALRRPWRWASCDRRSCFENCRGTREANRGGLWALGSISGGKSRLHRKVQREGRTVLTQRLQGSTGRLEPRDTASNSG